LNNPILFSSRPSLNQKANYSGFKGQHGLVYQAVTTANGLVIDLDGPFPGRYNDSRVVIETDLLARVRKLVYDVRIYILEQNRSPLDGSFFLFGDKGYSCRQMMMSSFNARGGRQLTKEERKFNDDMATGRVSTENIFGRIVNIWRSLNKAADMRFFVNDPDECYLAAVFLTNCLTCLDGGNIVSDRFSYPPPQLEEYLSWS